MSQKYIVQTRCGRELENFLASRAQLLAIWRVKSSHELSYEIGDTKQKSSVTSVKNKKKEIIWLASPNFPDESRFAYEFNPRPPLV